MRLIRYTVPPHWFQVQCGELAALLFCFLVPSFEFAATSLLLDPRCDCFISWILEASLLLLLFCLILLDSHVFSLVCSDDLFPISMYAKLFFSALLRSLVLHCFLACCPEYTVSVSYPGWVCLRLAYNLLRFLSWFPDNSGNLHCLFKVCCKE